MNPVKIYELFYESKNIIYEKKAKIYGFCGIFCLLLTQRSFGHLVCFMRIFSVAFDSSFYFDALACGNPFD